MFDPEAMIGMLSQLVDEINEMRAHLSDECEEIAECWEGLGRVGGKRADHAAALLSRLRPHLMGLARFADRCNEQITAMIANPFGDTVEARMG